MKLLSCPCIKDCPATTRHVNGLKTLLILFTTDAHSSFEQMRNTGLEEVCKGKDAVIAANKQEVAVLQRALTNERQQVRKAGWKRLSSFSAHEVLCVKLFIG